MSKLVTDKFEDSLVCNTIAAVIMVAAAVAALCAFAFFLPGLIQLMNWCGEKGEHFFGLKIW